MPGEPLKWKHGKLEGKNSFLDIKNVLADQITDAYERYAPGFKKQILNRYIYSPLEQERNNPSAIQGCWAGGSVIPEQFLRQASCCRRVRRRRVQDFHEEPVLSNSIHPSVLRRWVQDTSPPARLPRTWAYASRNGGPARRPTGILRTPPIFPLISA